MSYVGCGQGEYAQETTYRYVGYGGDFDQTRARDFTCIITGCGLLALLLLIPLLIWCLMPDTSTDGGFDCSTRDVWGPAKLAYCCANFGLGCPTTTANFVPIPPTPPPTTQLITTQSTFRPTQPTAPPPPGDPWNCAVDPEYLWCSAKKEWCCRIHHLGCRTNMPTVPPPQPDPYNCADGFSNWQAGWSVAKKAWCCAHHSKGCPGGGGCGTTRAPYDCNAGFSNWQAGWSVAKKAWCCQHGGKGCPGGGGCGTTAAPYDCNAGFWNWQHGWSVPKKAWCCRHESKGCPTAGGCA